MNIRFILFLYLLLSSSISNAQLWEAIGPDDFDQLSHNMTTGDYSIDFQNNTPYVAYVDKIYTNKGIVKKYNSAEKKWETVGNIDFFKGVVNKIKLVFNNNIPYIAYTDSFYGSKIIVKKLNIVTNTWESIGGNGSSTKKSDNISLVFDNNIPYITCKDLDNGSRITVLKYNGSSDIWETLGNPGFSFGFVPYFSLAFEEGVPYVAYKDGTQGSIKIKKLNTTNNTWDFIGNQNFGSIDVKNVSIIFDEQAPYLKYDDGDVYVKKLNTINNKWEDITNTPIKSYNGGIIKFIENKLYSFDIYNGTLNSYTFNNTTKEWENLKSTVFSISPAVNPIITLDNLTPYVLYQENENNLKLKLKKYVLDSFEDVSIGGFSGGVAQDLQMAVSNTTPYVGYRDFENGYKVSVKKLNLINDNWESVGQVAFSKGPASSLSLSLAVQNETPYVAYADYTNGNKATVEKYDSQTNSWETVGTRGFSSGGALNIVLTINNGKLYVGYQDGASSEKLTVMTYDTNLDKWILIGNAGFSNGEVSKISMLFNRGIPYVAFCDHSNFKKPVVMKLNPTNNIWEIVGNSIYNASVTAIGFAMKTDIPYIAYSGNKVYVKKLNINSNTWDLVGNEEVANSIASRISMSFKNDFLYIISSPGKNEMKRLNAKNNWEIVGTELYSPGYSTKNTSLDFIGEYAYISYSNADVYAKRINIATTLPIKVKSFEAKIKEDKVVLNWETLNEYNNHHFEILNSSDGKNFNSILKINSQGNSDIIKRYEALHLTPYSGSNYYKLQQIDKSGELTELAIKHVNFKIIPQITLEAYPNPTTADISLAFKNIDENKLNVTIFDLNGIVRHQETFNINNLNNGYLKLSTSNHLTTGNYIINVKGEKLNRNLKITVK